MDRRRLIGGAAALAAMTLLPAVPARAHTDESDIGFAAAWARKMASPELERAETMHELANFLPAFRTAAGYRGYVLATDRTDPSISVPLWLLENEAAEAAAIAAAQTSIEGLHPALASETISESRGRLGIFRLTERTREELPPGLTGAEFRCGFAMARRESIATR